MPADRAVFSSFRLVGSRETLSLRRRGLEPLGAVPIELAPRDDASTGSLSLSPSLSLAAPSGRAHARRPARARRRVTLGAGLWEGRKTDWGWGGGTQFINHNACYKTLERRSTSLYST